MTCKTEKISLPTKQAIKRKKEDLKEIKEHVFTEDEITNMIQKKRELNIVGNTTMEHFRLQNELEAAKFTGDQDKIEELEKQIEELDSLHEPSRTASADLIARLNAKNKEKDLQEGQKAELKALVIKRKQGVSESDPFARRKTQPVHIISE
jgi:acetyl-CoA carboxylase beta subunit